MERLTGLTGRWGRMSGVRLHMVTVFLMLIAGSGVYGQRFVKQGGTGDGGSWATAAGNLQATIDACPAGQQVWVAAGTYQQPSGQSFSMKSGVKIYGGFPATGNPAMESRNPAENVTILQGNNNRVIYNVNVDTAAWLDGFTIQGGTLTSGHGAGIYNMTCHGKFINCVIRNNTTTEWGGGAYSHSSYAKFINCLFYGNTASGGGAIFLHNTEVGHFNCTVTANHSNVNGGGIHTHESGASSFYSSILWANNALGNGDEVYTTGSSSINGLFSSASNEDGDIYGDFWAYAYGDPMFTDPANNNYLPTSDSPAVNYGNITYEHQYIPTDLAGKPRTYGPAIDRGAYEVQTAPTTIRYVKQGGTGNGTSWANASGDLQAMITASSAGDKVWVAAGTYQPAVNQSFSMKDGVKIYGGFANSGTPTFGERNWITNVTTLQGNNTRVLNNTNNGLTTSSLLDGFTITNGTAGQGGGIYGSNVSPTLSNLVVTNNYASSEGGGIYFIGGSPVLSNVSITQNTIGTTGNNVRRGGGFYSFSSSPVLINVFAANNVIVGTGGFGGGLCFAQGSPSLLNVTIAGNTAATGSGVHTQEGALQVRNSIVWNNSFSIASGTAALYSNIVQGSGGSTAWNSGYGTDNGGNMDLDPLFVNSASGNYRLIACSPAANTGNNLFMPSDVTKDLSGNARIFGAIIDKGAYEFQGTAVTAPVASAQTFCGSQTVANLVATGTSLKWYSVASGGTALLSTAAIATGTYYVSQTASGCESARTAVSVTLTNQPAPAASAQNFCGSATVANLTATGTAIKWYTVATGGTALASTVSLSTATYYVSQTLNGCESPRTAVTVTVNSIPAAPTGTALILPASATVTNLTATGQGLKWYNVATGGTQLNTATTVTAGTYYVSQTVNGCESARTAIAVTIFSSATVYVRKGFTGDGSSWTNAMGELANALQLAKTANASLAGSVTQIWVGAGTYKPLLRADNFSASNPADRDNAFVLVNNVKIYGGFAGTETVLADRNLALTANASILSGDFSENDIFDASGHVSSNNTENAYHVVISTGVVGTAQLDGFTISGGFANASGATLNVGGTTVSKGAGGGMTVYNSSPQISNMVFEKNSSSSVGVALLLSNSASVINTTIFRFNKGGLGAGIHCQTGSTPTITNCLFSDNFVNGFGSGGGISVAGGNATINKSIFKNNKAGSGAGVYSTSATVSLKDCLFFGNISLAANGAGGGLLTLNSTGSVLNTTFAANEAINGAGIFYSGGNVAVHNSIIWGNTATSASGYAIEGSGGSMVFKNTLVQGTNSSGTSWPSFYGTNSGGNIAGQDPLFTNAAIADYTLSAASPARNSGDTTLYTNASSSTDLSGNPRVNSALQNIDMGAYESQLTVYAPSVAGVLYVKKGVTGGTGASWTSPIAELGDALKTANDLNAITPGSISQIWVSGGTYKPMYRANDLDGSNPTDLMNSFKLVNDVDVYGGFAGTETSVANRDLSLSANASILNGDFNGDDAYDSAGLLSGNYGDNAMHVVIGAQITAETFFDGFTIQGGNTGGGGFIMEGVYMENTFGSAINTRNCLVNLQNLIVKKNRSVHANGAIGNLFGPSNIANSLIVMNSGGAIENNSGAITITNCTIAMNASSGTGAGLTSSGSFAVRNSILWNNAGTSPYFQSTNVSAGGSGSFQNSIIETAFTSSGTWTIAGTNSGGNSDLNPLFTNANGGDFTLNVVSPARNMANATFLSSTITKDLAGNARTYGSAMDIGTYENQQSGASPSQSGIIYVVKGQSGEGSSWASPLGELADALKVAKLMPEGAVKQIWVAGGIYKPMYRPDNLESTNSADRHNTFLMVPRLKIFGGFAGTETTLEQRDLAQEGNKSILSGDLSSNDTFGTYGQLEGNYSDNAYHVVLGPNLIWFSTVTTGAQINGFTVTGGNADGSEVVTANGIADISAQYGGGMYILNCTNSPALVNMVFKGNRATYGGAIASTTAAIMNNILFTGNIATVGGSAIYSKGSSITINNCTVSKNFTQYGFSGVYMDATTPGFITVRNSILSDNPYTAPASAGSFTTALRHYNTNLDTASSVSGAWQAAYGMNMGGNSAAQPLFMNPEAGDFKLQPGSSNINGGSNTLYTTGLSTTDLVGKTRFYNTTIDRGAYEFDGVVCTGVNTVATQYVSENKVNISWQGIGDESSFEYAITTNTIPPTSGTPTSDEFANNVTVTPNVTNYLHIKNNCKWIRHNFYQGYCTPAPSTVNNQGIVKVVVGAMVKTSGAETGNYGNYTADTILAPAGKNQDFAITYATGRTYFTKIWVDWNGDSDFTDIGETVYAGESGSANPTTLNGMFEVPAGMPAGNYRLRIGGIDVPSLDALTPCYTGTLGTFEDYTLAVIPCPQWTGAISNDWDTAANWCDGVVPTITTDVTLFDVENDPVINDESYVRNIFLSDGASLTVNSGATLTVISSVLVSDSGNLTIENNGSLVQDDDVENTGNVTVIKNSNSLFKQDYTVWSSPVAGQNLLEFSPETLDNRFYTYGINANGNEAYVPASAAGYFTEGSGYLIRMPDQVDAPNTDNYNAGTQSHVHEGIFTGVPHNGTLEIPMSVEANFTSMVGNPYASPINVAEFFSQNAAVLSPVHGLYFWRKRNNADATSYATLNTIAYTANDGGTLAGANGVFDDVNNYGGQQWENYFGSTPAADWTIATAQGFFVVGNGLGGDLKFTNMMRTSSNSGQPFFRMNPPVPAPVSRIWLNLNNETNFSQIAVAYTDNATLGLDFGMDSKQFSGGKISIYSLAEGEKLGIQGRPEFEDTDVVPLGYSVLDAGSYSISLHRKDGLFSNGQLVYLKDNLLNTVYDFAQGPYGFATEGGTFDNRFEVIYTNGALSVSQHDADPNNIIVYKKDTDLHINSGKLQMASVRIFDIRGRIVYERAEVNASNTLISDLHIEQEVIIVQVTTDEGVIVSKKVVF